jgi:2,3-bisphosphoglycerate-independent phosphoglycerate mutase
MTWLAVKIFFDKVLLWCKKYWQILLGISIPLVIMLLTAGRKNDLRKALEFANKKAKEDREAMEESHRIQLEAKEEEIKAKEEASAELIRRIHEIETTHKVSVDRLNRKQKKELNDLLSRDSDPVEVSEKLADLFGTDIKS